MQGEDRVQKELYGWDTAFRFRGAALDLGFTVTTLPSLGPPRRPPQAPLCISASIKIVKQTVL